MKKIPEWRLLDSPPLTAAENMALDETIVELRGENKTVNTIHFIQFSPRCVLLGYHQLLEEEIRVDYCLSNGIDINRRITGGGGLFFDESQLGWEIICHRDFFEANIPNLKLFKILCEPIVTALRNLGLESKFRPRNDIEINGRKISGTGGTESGDAFLFQGTMLTDFDVNTMLRALRIPIEKLKAKEIDSVKERVTCLKWELGYTPTIDTIKKAVADAFERHLGIKLIPGDLTVEEKMLFEEKLKYFRSPDWINKVHSPFRKKDIIRAGYKSEYGMVRFTMSVDLMAKRIREILITGDFISFPSKALYNLEALLRGEQFDKNNIHFIIKKYFEDGHIVIDGMTFDDFIKPVDQIFEKAAITQFGIPIEYCNNISVTNGSFATIMKKKPKVLFLPYCSKLSDCKFRHKKGCSACGKCSYGDALSIGIEAGLKPICINNYEDLWAELKKMKRKGDDAFIGCCCEPFFVKHHDDFTRSGVSGLLLDIDNTTCYDLDQAQDAYSGAFSSQTSLNLDLLKSVLSATLD